MRLKDPRDLPAAARDLQRRRDQTPTGSWLTSPSPPGCSVPGRRSGSFRPRRSPPQKSRCTSRPIAWPTHPTNAISHLHQPAVDTERENQRENDTDRYELEAQSRQVAGAAKRKARARSPSRKTAYPTAVSQRRPLSRIGRSYGRARTEPPGVFSCREKSKRQLAWARGRLAPGLPRLSPADPRYAPSVRRYRQPVD
jgi:hypothetical protein